MKVRKQEKAAGMARPTPEKLKQEVESKKQKVKRKKTGERNMKIRPLDDRVLVQQSEAEEKTAGGIVLPDSAKEKPQRGKVIEVGAGKLLDSGQRGDMCVKKGDEVYYAKYAGTDIEIDKKKYVILRESDVLGIVEK
jgi:chaperonin GroES